MSSDLLAEFDAFYQAPSGAPQADLPKTETGRTQNHSFFDDLLSLDQAKPNSQTTSNGPSADQENEDWGAFSSFEEVGASPIPQTLQEQSNNEQGTLWDDLGIFDTTGQPLQAHHQPTSSNAQSISQQGHHDRSPIHESGRDTHVDVLFDAEAPDSGDDEFGDFESVNAEPLTQPLQTPEAELWPSPTRDSAANIGLEGLELSRKSLPLIAAPESPSFKERNPFAELLVPSTKVPEDPRQHHETGTPITAWPSFVPSKSEPRQPQLVPEAVINDDWGDFSVSPALPMAAVETAAKTGDREWEFLPPRTTDMPLKLPPKSETTAAPITTSSSKPTTASPPTNIPPPSILLSLFPALFNLPETALFTPLSTQPASLKDRILSDPSTITFMRGYLHLATVCARLIAGRKQRWKRDIHLSQSMKIGSAQSSKLSGMKLTGIDKGENLKEERDVADVVRIWKEQLGKLRSAVAAANASGASPPLGVIPEIAGALSVRVGKVAEGAVVAEKACVLCGLKREERVEKVDFSVEDTFGEWWVEYWGHTACHNFWEEHKDELRQR